VGKYILFGAGANGQDALSVLGKNNVECFCDNGTVRTCYCEKKVISFLQLKKIYFNYIVIVTVEKPDFLQNIKMQLECAKIPYITYQEYLFELLKKKSVDKTFQSTYFNEITYMLNRQQIQMLPYPFSEKYKSEDVQLFYDNDQKLYFYWRNDKKLYFPEKWSSWECKKCVTCMLAEQDEESPHKYFSEAHMVTSNDIFIDVGCAEALVALDIVDIAKKIYLFEGDALWNKALKATFAPYEKVVFFDKMVGNRIEENMVTLDSIFQTIDDNLFIKVDIEGSEMDFLLGARETLKKKNVKLSLCVYHHEEDEDVYGKFLDDFGFEINTTSGYVFVYGSFRRGVIQAFK